MTTYIIRRVLLLIPTLIGISFISFGLIFLAPGDPALVALRAGGTQRVDQKMLEEMRIQMGLDKPVPQRYLAWLGDVLQFNFGKSVRTGADVDELLVTRFPATIELGVATLLIALLISLPLGIITAVNQHTPIDHLGRLFAFLGASMPSFWLALLLMLLFAVKLDWLPALGYGEPQHIVLPAVALSLSIAPTYARLLRANMVEVLNQPYVIFARAKGLGEGAIVLRHALRNALIPFVTVFGISVAHILAGAVVVETIFAWPGVGKLVVDSILARDFPVVQAFVVIAASFFVLANLVVDLSYQLLNPRIRLGSEE